MRCRVNFSSDTAVKFKGSLKADGKFRSKQMAEKAPPLNLAAAPQMRQRPLLSHLSCRAYAGVISPYLDVKGKMTIFTTFDLQPHRRYDAHTTFSDKPAAALNQLTCSASLNGVHTEFALACVGIRAESQLHCPTGSNSVRPHDAALPLPPSYILRQIQAHRSTCSGLAMNLDPSPAPVIEFHAARDIR